MDSTERGRHWDTVHTQERHSWDEATPAASLEMIAAAGVATDATVIDVGGGEGRLVEALLDRGHREICVLDVSRTALDRARERLGARASDVGWVVADVTAWEPDRCWQLWHDRAVFHFLTDAGDRDAYGRALMQGTSHGSVVVIGGFATDGPEQCSGLPVQRYTPAGLQAALPPVFTLVASHEQVHTTPDGHPQPFVWVALRRT